MLKNSSYKATLHCFYLTDEECKLNIISLYKHIISCFYLTDEECKFIHLMLQVLQR